MSFYKEKRRDDTACATAPPSPPAQDKHLHEIGVSRVACHVQERALLHAVLRLDNVSVGLEAEVNVVYVSGSGAFKNRLGVRHSLAMIGPLNTRAQRKQARRGGGYYII